MSLPWGQVGGYPEREGIGSSPTGCTYGLSLKKVRANVRKHREFATSFVLEKKFEWR
jgi:hypothetical protein